MFKIDRHDEKKQPKKATAEKTAIDVATSTTSSTAMTATDKNIEAEDELADEGEGEGEEEVKQLPFLLLADYGHLLSLSDSVVPAAEKKEIASKAAELVTKECLPGWYSLLIPSAFRDPNVLAAAEKDYAESIATSEAEMAEAKASSDEGDVLNFRLEIVRKKILAGSGDARIAFDEVFPQVIGNTFRIDLLFSILLWEIAMISAQRVILATPSGKTRHNVELTGIAASLPSFNANVATQETMAQLEVLVEKAGDWTRRNRINSYKSILLPARRELELSSQLACGVIPTFSATELLSMEQFAHIVVPIAIATLSRSDLFSKVIEAPDMIPIFEDCPLLKELIMSFYECRYAAFFRALLSFSVNMKKDRYLSPSDEYLLRELRVKVYQQFLSSYSSVTVNSMASLFDVSPKFIDQEISHFIAAGRLQCRIDSVDGIIEMGASDPRATVFAQLLKHGDLLTSRVQRMQQKLKNI